MISECNESTQINTTDINKSEIMEHNKWRVYNGAEFKFYLDTKEEALEYAIQFGGTLIGHGRWDEELGTVVYQNVQAVPVKEIEGTPMDPKEELELREKVNSLTKRTEYNSND